ncbi:MAG: type IV pilus assembly protein PilM, partial [Terriglobia bacterium]
VSASLSQLAKDAGTKGARVIVGISNQKLVIRFIDLPYMAKDELKSSIRFQAQEFIPISVEDAILDYQVTKEYINKDGERMIEVLLVAAQKEMVEQSVQAVEKSGLRPIVIDVSSFALVRSLSIQKKMDPAEQDEETPGIQALVNIGSGVTDIAMAEHGMPRFVRVSSLAGNSFTKAISEILALSWDEAEELKVEVGLPNGQAEGETENDTTSDPQRAEIWGKAREVLETEGHKLAMEVRRSFDYYLSQSEEPRTIQKLVLSGGGARLRNLAEFLEKEFQTTVELNRPLENLDVETDANGDVAEDELALAIPIGLALRGVS